MSVANDAAMTTFYCLDSPNGEYEIGTSVTPLHTAAKHARMWVAQTLINYGAEVNARNKKGETPMRWADHYVRDILARNGGQ